MFQCCSHLISSTRSDFYTTAAQDSRLQYRMIKDKLIEICNGVLSVIVSFNLQLVVKESQDLKRLGFWAFSPVLGPKKSTSNVRIEIIDEINDVGQRKITV